MSLDDEDKTPRRERPPILRSDTVERRGNGDHKDHREEPTNADLLHAIQGVGQIANFARTSADKAIDGVGSLTGEVSLMRRRLDQHLALHGVHLSEPPPQRERQISVSDLTINQTAAGPVYSGTEAQMRAIARDMLKQERAEDALATIDLFKKHSWSAAIPLIVAAILAAAGGLWAALKSKWN